MSKATEYCLRVFDGTHETPKPTSHGFKLLTSKNILNGTLNKNDAYYISEEDYNSINQRSQVSQWDVLFSMIGTVGNVCIITDKDIDFAIKNMGCFSCKDEKRAKWLYYYLQSPTIKRLIQYYLNGAVQKFVPLDWLRNIDIPDFDKSKEKIVNILWNLDAKISLNRSIISDLESLAKQIYDYWFVQFDFPDEHGRPYKSSGGKMVWNDKLKRYIPAAWDVVKLGDICESMIAGDWGKSEPTGNYTKEVFCIRGADIPDVQCGSKGKMPTRYILSNNFETKRLTENNLVVEISGGSPIQSTGRIAIVTKQLLDLYDNRIICTNFCKALKIKSECVYLIYFMWRSLYDNRQMFSFEIGTTGIKNLDIAYILENVYIAIPPQNLLNSFNQTIEKFLNCMFSSSHENESLTSLRDFLLPMLMNGQVTVK